MMRSRTIVLLAVFCIYVVVAFFVRQSQMLLLIVTFLFAVISLALRSTIFVKKDKPCGINIVAEGAKITMTDSKIIVEDTKKPRDSSKNSG